MRNIENKEYLPNNEFPEITDKILRETLSSTDFQVKFSEAISLYNSKGREFGFSVIKNPQSERIWYGKVVGGWNDYQTDLSKSANPIREKLKKEAIEPHQFISFHIHPYEYGELVMPSVINGDLFDSNKDRIFMDPKTFENILLPSFSLIATPNPEKINVLAYREPLTHNPFELTESIRQLDESMDYVETQDEVLDLLRQIGYSAEMLEAGLDCKFTDESLEKFGKLGYKPINLGFIES